MLKFYSTLKSNDRESNYELLRIVSMLFILSLHTNFSGIGCPVLNDIINNPAESYIRNLVESLTIVGVNCFVFISGWFELKLNKLKLSSLLFQCLFIYILIYLFFIISGIKSATIKNTYECLNFFNRWFITAYIGLTILSPLINSAIKNCNKNTLKNILILLGLFLCFVCWISKIYYPIANFIFLYVLARYIKEYKGNLFSFNKWIDFSIYILIAIITAFITSILELKGHGCSIFILYNSPFIVVSSLYLFLFFSKIKIRSRLINWIAVSSLAVYLINCNSFLRQDYSNISINLYKDNTFPIFSFKISIVILIYFITCILIDKLRIIIWEVLMMKINSKTKKDE